jgi:hypothetical protein
MGQQRQGIAAFSAWLIAAEGYRELGDEAGVERVNWFCATLRP